MNLIDIYNRFKTKEMNEVSGGATVTSDTVVGEDAISIDIEFLQDIRERFFHEKIEYNNCRDNFLAEMDPLIKTNLLPNTVLDTKRYMDLSCDTIDSIIDFLGKMMDLVTQTEDALKNKLLGVNPNAANTRIRNGGRGSSGALSIGDGGGSVVDQINPISNIINDSTKIEEFAEFIKLNSDIDLSKLLTDPQYNAALLALLYKFYGVDNIPNDVLKDGDYTTLSEKLLSIIIKKNPEVLGFAPTTTKYIDNFIARLAKENKVSVNELLTNPKYKLILKKSMDNLADARQYLDNATASNETSQADLAGIYNGTDVAEKNINPDAVVIVREYTETVSGDNNVGVESLLCDQEHAQILKDNIGNLQKALTTIGGLSTNNVDGLQGTLRLIISSGTQ